MLVFPTASQPLVAVVGQPRWWCWCVPFPAPPSLGHAVPDGPHFHATGGRGETH